MNIKGKIVNNFGVLDSCRCELIRTTPTGTKVVKLLENRKVYGIGDIVHLSSGEFQKE